MWSDSDIDTDTDFFNHCAIQVTQFSCDDLDLLAPAGWLLFFNLYKFVIIILQYIFVINILL